MRFVVYLDSLFLINFVMNLYVLLILNHIYLGISENIRMILGAIVGTVGFFILFLLPIGGLPGLAIGFGVGEVMMLSVAFSHKRVQNRRKLLGRAVAITFFLGGGLLFLTRMIPFFPGGTKGVLFSGGIGLVLFFLYQNTLPENHFDEKRCTGIVKIGVPPKCFPAFVDSGNHLYEPISQKPVCVASSQVIQEILGDTSGLFRVVPYRSVGGGGCLKAYPVRQMQIELDGNTYRIEKTFLADGETLPFGTEDARDVPGVILHPGLFDKKERKEL